MRKTQQNSLNKSLPIIISLVSLLSLIAGLRLGMSMEVDGIIRKADKSPTDAIDQALMHIHEKYYGTVDYDRLTEGVLDEMMRELDDYSNYFRSEADQQFNHFIDGTYSGLGFIYFRWRDTTYITSVLPSSPADDAGMSSGDILLSIDGVDLSDGKLTMDSIRQMSRRKDGDSIDLKWYAVRQQKIMDQKLVTGNVRVPIVHSYLLEDSSTLYIDIDRFSNGSFTAFMDAIDRYTLTGLVIEGLIIDVRGNPGGVLSEAIKMLNQLILEKGLVLTSTKDNRGRLFTYRSNGRTFLTIEKIVVLIDENSASASEILAGSLQDYDRAVIVGRPSYGKGLIQQNFGLSNQGSINMTVGEYFLPSGRSISHIEYGTDSTQSLFETLNRKRPLRNTGGVVPDVILTKSTCMDQMGGNMVHEVYRELIEKGADLSQYLMGKGDQDLTSDVIDNLISQYSLPESCRITVRRTILWEIYSYLNPGSGEVHSGQTDETIREAYRIIHEPDYERQFRSILE